MHPLIRDSHLLTETESNLCMIMYNYVCCLNARASFFNLIKIFYILVDANEEQSSREEEASE